MTRIIRFRTASLTMIMALAALCWFTLGCGLFDGDQPEATPPPEPDIQATIDAALGSIEATREAAAPAAAAEPTVTAEPASTATASPAVAATTEPSGHSTGALSELGPDPLWGDLFPVFTEAEQACIRGELDKEQLALGLESPVFHEEPTKQWESAIFACLEQETAVTLFRTFFVYQTMPEAELTEATDACLQDLLADTDAVGMMAGFRIDAAPGKTDALIEFLYAAPACFAELAAGMTTLDEITLWSFYNEGWVSTAPAVADGVVYVGSDAHRVYALDAASGSELWSFAIGGAVNAGPVVADGVLYVGSDDNHLYALDAASGAMLWSYDTGDWIEHSPVVSGDRLYARVLVDGQPRVAALDAATGEVLWTAATPNSPDAGFAHTVVGNTVYVPGADFGTLHALDAATGEINWTVFVNGYFFGTAPTVLDGVVYLTASNEAHAMDAMTGDTIWIYDTGRFASRDFPALVVNGVYYLSPNEFLHAVDAARGEQLWAYQADSPISVAPVVADGVVIAATESGRIFAVDAASGTELWTMTTDDREIWTTTVVDGVLYAETSWVTLLAVDAVNGQIIGEYEQGTFPGASNYAVHEGVLYLGYSPNGVHAYAVPQP